MRRSEHIVERNLQLVGRRYRQLALDGLVGEVRPERRDDRHFFGVGVPDHHPTELPRQRPAGSKVEVPVWLIGVLPDLLVHVRFPLPGLACLGRRPVVLAIGAPAVLRVDRGDAVRPPTEHAELGLSGVAIEGMIRVVELRVVLRRVVEEGPVERADEPRVGERRLAAHEPVVVLGLVVRAGAGVFPLGGGDAVHAGCPRQSQPHASPLGAILVHDVHHARPHVAVLRIESPSEQGHFADEHLVQLRVRLARERIRAVQPVHLEPDFRRPPTTNLEFVSLAYAHARLVGEVIEHPGNRRFRYSRRVHDDLRRRDIGLDRRALGLHHHGLHLDGLFTQREVHLRGQVCRHVNVGHRCRAVADEVSGCRMNAGWNQENDVAAVRIGGCAKTCALERNRDARNRSPLGIAYRPCDLPGGAGERERGDTEGHGTDEKPETVHPSDAAFHASSLLLPRSGAPRCVAGRERKTRLRRAEAVRV